VVCLVQDADVDGELTTNVVTMRRPTKAELNAMLFGWRVVKHVKSNAIVYAKADRTLGIGAGQMSRVDASRIAVLESEGRRAFRSKAGAGRERRFSFRSRTG